MNLPVRVTPTERLFSITWNTGPRCNFSCSYCPPHLNDKVSKHKTLDELKRIWLDIVEKSIHRGLDYKISFSGGEPTINPNFLLFLEWLSTDDRIKNIGFTSNGSTAKARYLKAIDYVDYITFSTHFEFMLVDKFKDTVLSTHLKAIELKKNIFVNIMDEHFAKDKVENLEKWCVEHKIPHSKMIIHWGDHAKARRESQLQG
jgi:MoaA/NifB/PqqE/SkfB family radical SAM enzyme